MVIDNRTHPQNPAPRRLSRRHFLSWLVVSWAAFSASVAVMAAATTRFFFPNVLFEPSSEFEAGLPVEIKTGAVDERFKESKRVWIVRDAGRIYALRAICTHLGCTPNWFPDQQIFKCPCHGSGYYKSGVNFEGPTPRPLERVAIRLAADGQIEIDTSVTFRYEKGEWSDPRSYLNI
ncbi:MAG TPA: ubiquinol-cytochrome c reductase iron-sulfur subunit [Terriglobia bacterium]|nr:ubiquinol-cytochrome c reductase iron-sulfur subunit [Terriglobia bacterium]